MKVDRTWQSRQILLGSVFGVAAALATACAPTSYDPEPGVSPATPAEPSAVGVAARDSALWLEFEGTRLTYDGFRAFADPAGTLVGRVVTGSSGTLSASPGPDGSGQAVTFPAACDAPRGCPRALVEVAHTAALDPAQAEFSFGASVRLDPDQSALEANIMQKGLSAPPNRQWKLQVDAGNGQPSCVVRDYFTVRVQSPESISDGLWHDVVCAKTASDVSISVDGLVSSRSVAVQSVGSDLPILIGSAGVDQDDDQFHGSLDDVFLRIEAP